MDPNVYEEEEDILYEYVAQKILEINQNCQEKKQAFEENRSFWLIDAIKQAVLDLKENIEPIEGIIYEIYQRIKHQFGW